MVTLPNGLTVTLPGLGDAPNGPAQLDTFAGDIDDRFGVANPTAILTKTANQSIANGVYSDVTWVTASDHSPGTGYFTIASTTITVLKAGLYRVKAECAFDPANAGNRFARLMLNGVNKLTVRREADSTTTFLTVDRTLKLAANDVLKIMSQVTFTTGGAAVNMVGDPTERLSVFEVEYQGSPAA